MTTAPSEVKDLAYMDMVHTFLRNAGNNDVRVELVVTDPTSGETVVYKYDSTNEPS